MKRGISTLMAIGLMLMPLCLCASTSYEALAAKARQFYDNKEWASASAMYSLMLDERPTDPQIYGLAIVTAGLRHLPIEQISLIEQAMRYHVPFDSVFANVEHQSFMLGKADIYENFMVQVKESEPWMTRTVNGYLLDFYTFRRNPEKMVEYSRMMLDGLPDSTRFLYTLAQGYLIGGDFEDALDTYRRITEIDPEAYDALLYLGNYYRDKGDTAQALSYLTRANDLKATPFVTKTLNSLSE